MKPKIIALVPAAGTGTRLGDALPKQYLDINGYPMIYHVLSVLSRVPRIVKICVVLSPHDSHWQPLIAEAEAGRHLANRIVTWPVGGPSRGESVLNGLKAMAGDLAAHDWVMVHDAARPCIRPDLVDQLIDVLDEDPVGGLLALPLADTIKRDDGNLRAERTLEREGIWRAQTPQMFRYGMLVTALQGMPDATDEAQAIEVLGHRPRLVMGDSSNLKVTYAPDLALARMLLTGGV